MLSFSYFEYSTYSSEDFNIIPISQEEMQTFTGYTNFSNKIYSCYIRRLYAQLLFAHL